MEAFEVFEVFEVFWASYITRLKVVFVEVDYELLSIP